MIEMCFNRKYKQRIQELENIVLVQIGIIGEDEILIEDLINQVQELTDEINRLNKQIEIKDNGKYSLYLIKEDGSKWFEESYSVEEMVRATGISRATLMGSLTKGEPLKGGKNAKYDSKYVGSQVVSADEWYERQS